MARSGDRQFAPATQRNREFILEVLQQVLPDSGTVLEVGSGTGEHAVFFAMHLPHLHWLPSDPNPMARASIAAWRAECGMQTLHPPLPLDACQEPWPVEIGQSSTTLGHELLQQPITAIVSINVIHIAPWEACLGLMAGAGRILSDGGVLYLYGPYKKDGKHTAPSNAAFDLSLRSQNPDWGVRNLQDVMAVAESEGLQLQQVVDMPANNLSVVFSKG